MEIIFTQDYKQYQKNEIVCLPERKATKLISKGFAKEAPEYWLPCQLSVAELFTATRIARGCAIEGIHERWAIISPYTARIPEYYTLTETRYHHILTGASFRVSHPNRNVWGAEGLNKIVVNSSTIKPFTQFFMNYMIEHNIDCHTKLFKEDLVKLENAINNRDTQKSTASIQDETIK